MAKFTDTTAAVSSNRRIVTTFNGATLDFDDEVAGDVARAVFESDVGGLTVTIVAGI